MPVKTAARLAGRTDIDPGFQRTEAHAPSVIPVFSQQEHRDDVSCQTYRE